MHPNDPAYDDSPATVERLELICEKLCNMEIGRGDDAVYLWLKLHHPEGATKYIEDGVFDDDWRQHYYEDRFDDPDMQDQIEQEVASENERGYEESLQSEGPYQGGNEG